MSKVTEEELAKAATGKRVTLGALEANIADEKFIKATDVLTICVLTLNNGFTVTGESACADPSNYNQEIGERLAREQAKNKIWPLMGYSLRQELYELSLGITPAGSENNLLKSRKVPQHADMRVYIGTKCIHAKPMTRAAYNEFRGWTLPNDENGEDPGYLVEYTDQARPNTEIYGGYVSWSPKDVFENAYHEVGAQPTMTFVDRMRAELTDLQDKLNKLNAYIEGNEQFKRLTDDEQNDLREQGYHMENYGRVLVNRLNREGNKPTA